MLKVPVKLDIVRNFAYGMRANHAIEQKLGIKNVSQIDFENISTEETAVLMWGGLIHEDPSLTPEKVMDLVDEYSDLVTVMSSMFKAVTGNINGGEEEKKNQAAAEA